MLLESRLILSGEGGMMPDELIDYLLCREFGWTFEYVQGLSVYVRRAFLDLLQIARSER